MCVFVCVCGIPCLSVASFCYLYLPLVINCWYIPYWQAFEDRCDLFDSLLTGAIFLRVSFLLATPHSVKPSVANRYLISVFAHLLVFLMPKNAGKFSLIHLCFHTPFQSCVKHYLSPFYQHVHANSFFCHRRLILEFYFISNSLG